MKNLIIIRSYFITLGFIGVLAFTYYVGISHERKDNNQQKHIEYSMGYDDGVKSCVRNIEIGSVFEHDFTYHVSFMGYEEMCPIGDTLFFITSDSTMITCRSRNNIYYVRRYKPE